MKSRRKLKERALTDHQLKCTLGGTTSPTPSLVPNDQSSDARAVIIETGEN